MAIAEVNGQELYYEDSGGDGPAIIFSHGLYMDHEMFAPQVEALRDSWRCITWDERAHGSTVTSDDRFTYWDSAADLVGLLDHLGIERAVVAAFADTVADLRPALARAALDKPVTMLLFLVCFAALGAGNGALFQLVPLRWPLSTAVAGSMIGEIGALGGGLIPNGMGFSRQYTGTYL